MSCCLKLITSALITPMYVLGVSLTIRLVAQVSDALVDSLRSHHHQFSSTGHSFATANPYWLLLCHCHISVTNIAASSFPHHHHNYLPYWILHCHICHHYCSIVIPTKSHIIITIDTLKKSQEFSSAHRGTFLQDLWTLLNHCYICHLCVTIIAASS